MLRLLRLYLPRIGWLLLAVVVFEAAQSGLLLYLPRITSDIVDKGILVGDTQYIWSAGKRMLLVTVAQMICLTGGIYFGSRAAVALGRDLRRALFLRVSAFSAREVNQLGAPTLITRLTNDVQQIQVMMTMLTSTAVAAPIMAGFGIVMAVREDLQLSWVLVAAVPAFLIPIVIILYVSFPVFIRMQDEIDQVNRILREQMTGLRVIKAFVREPVELQRFAEANDDLARTSMTQGRNQAIMFPLTVYLQSVAGVAVVWFGARLVDTGETSVGAVFAFLGYVVLVLQAVMTASFMAVFLPRSAVSGHRIMEVLATEPSVKVPARAIVGVPRTGSVELREVEFRYPGAEEPVLADVSFAASPGQTTAIVGSTGAGKTSLVNLVPRLVDVTGGAVMVDGTDVRDLDLADLRSRIGLVPQKPFLFTGTIADNLCHGLPDATEPEMWEALEVAQAVDFVRAMPGGLEARINKGGNNVSGGQRQRLAIARAVIRRPSIYLFDDSFSALDAATDARLRAALRACTAEATVLMVAQRVSTIRHADQILVVEHGRVVGVGTHEQLLGICPPYAELVSSQLGAADVA